MIAHTVTAAEREKASRSEADKVHETWHRLFGGECRKGAECPRKESRR